LTTTTVTPLRRGSDDFNSYEAWILMALVSDAINKKARSRGGGVLII